jgi:hypothetical protein
VQQFTVFVTFPFVARSLIPANARTGTAEEEAADSTTAALILSFPPTMSLNFVWGICSSFLRRASGLELLAGSFRGYAPGKVFLASSARQDENF